MKWEDRADLAFRIAGVVLVAQALLRIPSRVQILWSLPEPLRELGGSPWYFIGVFALNAALGVFLMKWGRTPARWLLTGRPRPPSRVQEHLAIGLVLVGCALVRSGLTSVSSLLSSRATGSPGTFWILGISALALCGGLLVWLWRPVASVLARRLQGAAGRENSRYAVHVGVGLVLLGLSFGIPLLVSIASALDTLSSHRGTLTGGADGGLRVAVTIGALVLTAALAVAVVFFAGKLASLLAGERLETEPSPAGPRTWMAVALLLGLVFLLLHCVPLAWPDSPVIRDFLPVGARVIAALALLLVVALSLFLIAPKCFPYLASWLFGGDRESEEVNWAHGRLLLEIGITLIVLRYALKMPLVWRWEGHSRLTISGGWLSGLPVAAVLVALRGNVARRCLPGEAPDQGSACIRRRELLRPWLVFLGFLILLERAPLLPLTKLVLGPSAGFEGTIWCQIATLLPWTGAVTLILAARPLSRLLSFGPLLSRGKRAPG